MEHFVDEDAEQDFWETYDNDSNDYERNDNMDMEIEDTFVDMNIKGEFSGSVPIDQELDTEECDAENPKKEFHRNTRRNRTANLSNVIQKITANLEPVNQAKLLRKSLESSANWNVLDNLMLSAETETENENECKLVTGTLEYV